MITAKQVRAARALLGWSQQELADRALVSGNAVVRLERGDDSRSSTVGNIEKALRDAGVEFIPETTSKGEGVRLASPSGQ